MNQDLMDLSKSLSNIIAVAINSDLSADTIAKLQQQKQQILLDSITLVNTITDKINQNNNA